MSKLDKLLRELCPDGVECVKLGTLCSLITKQTGFDYTNHIKARLLMEPAENAVPYIQTKFFAGKNFNYQTDYYVPMDIVEQFPKITLDEKCILFSIVGASIGNVGLFPGERKCFLGGAICVAKVLPQYDVDYVYYCVESHNVQHQIRRKTKGAGQATITVEDIREFEIPLPPIEIQSEIVRILDNFTNLTAELVKELTARKTQYGYYRNKFLDFESSVSVKTIGDICDVVVGGEPPTDCIKGDVRDSTHIYPVWGNGKEVYGYSGTYKIDRDAVVISSIGANTGAVYYKEAFFTPIIRLKVILPKDNRINARFLFHALSGTTIKSKSSSVPNMNANEIKAIKIPVPPLDVQNRIVNVLDNFEKICSDLNIGLPAEIEARQKQYEYYRDKLLTFAETGNTILSRAEQSRAEQSRAEQSRAEQSRALIKLMQYVFGYVRISLGDIGSICMCKRILKSQTNTVSGVPFYKIGTFGKKADAYISQETFNEYRSKYNFPKKGDVLISAAGTIGRTVVYDGKPSYFQDSNIVWIDNDESVVLNGYLRYCYELKPWKASEGGTIPRLYNDNIAKAVIAVPSIEEQKRVVSILDRFDAICNDLTSGLPAEIEARQKQYEYYRDKLLTFKERG